MEGRYWKAPYQAHEYPSSVEESAEEGTSFISPEGANPNRRPRSSSTSSRPDVHTESFHEQQSFHSNTSSEGNGTGEDAVVSADQERQVLLLMLLAQVCALHDPTPKTFTIHVVELFERGILDRESIHFLFELGLVPSLSPTRRSIAASNSAGSHPQDRTNATTKVNHTDHKSNLGARPRDASDEEGIEVNTDSALTRTTTSAAAQLSAVFSNSNDPQRSAEAYAIRATLAHYERLQQQNGNNRGNNGVDCAPANNESSGNTNTPVQPWDAKHFPLSLSRYQREFVQVALLASGSFGQVYHATRKMDGCDYAIKKVNFDATGYSNDTIQEVVREVEVLAKVSDHDNVVRYYTSWLEPSWMTGGQAVEAASTSPNVQQRRLRLTNELQQMIQPIGDDDDNYRGGFEGSNDSSLFSSRFEAGKGNPSFSTSEPSSSRRWRHRRFSFGSSVDSADQSWTTYNDPSPSLATFDDSYLMDSRRHGLDSRMTGGRPLPSAPSYRYQISLYIQMQLCHPASLADWIRERNTKVPEKNYEERIGPALEIFCQVVKGLAHVHEKGIIHRDLKPANIFASKNGQVIKIGDFGLSKQLIGISRNGGHDSRNGSASDSISPTKNKEDSSSGNSHHEHWNNAKKGAIIPISNVQKSAIAPYRKVPSPADHLTVGIGTRSYAAPEQLQSKSYSTAADIFSLGLIFLELVCCFETEHERLHNFQECRQQRIPQWIEEKYPEIASVILSCTDGNPGQRPSASDILRMLSSTTPNISEAQVQTHRQGELHNALLRRSLERRNEEVEKHKKALEEKDREIETLRLEMERLKASSNGDLV